MQGTERRFSSAIDIGGGRLRSALLLWEHPAWSGLVALIVYAYIAMQNGPITTPSLAPYFNWLADAFLHGQLHLRFWQGITHDLSFFEGRLYPYWPPFPAILLMPLVAIFGVQFSDILFTLGIAALNVALVAIVLRRATERGIISTTPMQRALLVVFFAFGTVHLTLAPFGRVWFTGQLVGFACVALAYLAAITLRGPLAFGLAGLLIGCALLTRNHLILAGLWPAWWLLREHWDSPWRQRISNTLIGIAPAILAVVLLGAYNWARFGDPLDNGLNYHQMADRFIADYRRYGAFHPHYLATNLWYQYIAYPILARADSTMGGSLFLLSPLFFAVWRGLVDRESRPNNWILGATCLLVAIPILLLMGTGWIQWGPRYTLDFTLPLLLLTAIGIRRWPTWLIALLVAVSVAHYVYGISELLLWLP
jgi:hypothetical protein